MTSHPRSADDITAQPGAISADYKIEVKDIEYCLHPSGPLLARLYCPVGTGPFPAVVEVHGGAWVKFDRTLNEMIDRSLARAGVVVMAIDFRMPPEAKYPAAVSDVNLAIRWLKARAGDFGSRPDLVGGLGTSSGGHLLMLNALRPGDPKFANLNLPSGEGLDANLAFAAVCWPVLDPSSRYRMVQQIVRQELIDAHHAFWADEQEMAEGNPQHIVERSRYSALPPLLLIQGTADQNLTSDMAENFAEAYRRRGGAVRLKNFAGEEHAFITRSPESAASAQAIDDIRTFILERFQEMR